MFPSHREILCYFPEIYSFLDIALIRNNARVGSQIARALSKRNEKKGGHFKGNIKTQKTINQKMDSKSVSNTVNISCCSV